MKSIDNVLPFSRRSQTPESYVFTGHQTFALTYRWLPKAVQAVRNDPAFFRRPDAANSLGVGKNMASSIWFWCHATGMIEDHQKEVQLTPLAEILFPLNDNINDIVNGGGYGSLATIAGDYFLEDSNSLWLLHWQLARTPRPASTWFLFFSKWSQSVFSREDLADWLADQAERQGRTVSANTLRRDINVFLRTYVPQRHKSLDDTEALDNLPLIELGLIRSIDGRIFTSERTNRPSLHVALLSYAITDYWERVAGTQSSLPIEHLLWEPGSPGSTFRLSDPALVAMLESLPSSLGYTYDESAGHRLLLRHKNLQPLDILRDYFLGLYS